MTRFKVSKNSTLQTIKRSYGNFLQKEDANGDPDNYIYTANGIELEESDKMVDHNIKDGDVIEVAPRATGSPSDSDLTEVKRILHRTAQFVDYVFAYYNDMLDSDNFDKSKESIHQEIKIFMKLKKQALAMFLIKALRNWLKTWIANWLTL